MFIMSIPYLNPLRRQDKRFEVFLQSPSDYQGSSSAHALTRGITDGAFDLEIGNRFSGIIEYSRIYYTGIGNRVSVLAPKNNGKRTNLIKVTPLPPGTEFEDKDVEEEIENEFIERVDAV
jgi:hypothetical protein